MAVVVLGAAVVVVGAAVVVVSGAVVVVVVRAAPLSDVLRPPDEQAGAATRAATTRRRLMTPLTKVSTPTMRLPEAVSGFWRIRSMRAVKAAVRSDGGR